MNAKKRFEQIKGRTQRFVNGEELFLISLVEAAKTLAVEYGSFSEPDFWELCQRRMAEGEGK